MAALIDDASSSVGVTMSARTGPPPSRRSVLSISDRADVGVEADEDIGRCGQANSRHHRIPGRRADLNGRAGDVQPRRQEISAPSTSSGARQVAAESWR